MTKSKNEDDVLTSGEKGSVESGDTPPIKSKTMGEVTKNDNDPVELEERLCRNLEMMTTSFTQGAKRWLSIYYTSMFAFVLLAGYGFFLIYSLTSSVGRVADNMDQIVVTMDKMSSDLNRVSNNTTLMIKTMGVQSKHMSEMVYYMRDMNVAMAQMRYDMSVLNNNVSRPMNFMNTFMPW